MMNIEEARALRRLLGLRSEIGVAENRLRALHAAIQHANRDAAYASGIALAEENRRLKADYSHIREEIDTANAALDEATRASHTDPLTGLSNRLVLWDRLQHELAVAKRNTTAVAVLFLDLDNFKAINDVMGHDAGDQLLCNIAASLVSAVRSSDTVCRLGGDEFVLVLPDVSREDLNIVGAKFEALVAAPRLLNGKMVSSSVSIGFALYPDDGDEPEALVKQADLAMYRAKSQRTRDSASVKPKRSELEAD